MMHPEDVERVMEAEACRVQAATHRASAAWLRAWGAPGWIVESVTAAADWWRAQAERAEGRR